MATEEPKLPKGFNRFRTPLPYGHPKRMPPTTDPDSGGLPGWVWKLLLVAFVLALWGWLSYA